MIPHEDANRLRMAAALCDRVREAGAILILIDGRIHGYPRDNCLPFAPYITALRREVRVVLEDIVNNE